MPFRARSSPSWTGRRGPVVRNGGVRRAAAVSAARARSFPSANSRTAGFIGLEKKFFDQTVAATAFTLTWTGGELNPTADSLSACAQGDTESTCDGRMYNIQSIHVKGFVDLVVGESDSTPQPDVLARICMVWDTQTNAAELNAEDVMLNVASPNGVNSFRNLQNSHRFIVLKDKTIRIPVAQSTSNEGAVNLFANGLLKIPFKFNKTFKKPIKVRRNSGTTAAIANITDNSLHIIGSATSTNAQISYTSRMRFTG